MKKAQNLVEYLLIASLVAVMGVYAVSKVDFQQLKNYVFMRPADPSNASRIKIEAMTDVK